MSRASWMVSRAGPLNDSTSLPPDDVGARISPLECSLGVIRHRLREVRDRRIVDQRAGALAPADLGAGGPTVHVSPS